MWIWVKYSRGSKEKQQIIEKEKLYVLRSAAPSITAMFTQFGMLYMLSRKKVSVKKTNVNHSDSLLL